MRKVATVPALLAAAVALFAALGGRADAATTCASFQTQQQAQAFYDAHKNDNPSNPDPYNLDANHNGKACEGLPSAATVVPTPAPIKPAPLPNNGAETGVMAMSGLSLLEAGYGMTLLARRYGVKRRNIPVYLLRKLVSAGQSGQAAVALGDDVYLVHESALMATAEDVYRYVDLQDTERFELTFEEDGYEFMPPAEPPRLSVYASLAKGAEIVDDRQPIVFEVAEEQPEDSWDDDFSWRV